jgi:transposase
VVMEATSDYWKSPCYLLEAHGFETWLVNANDVKHLPGRPKTDRLDAVWLCKVAERQRLRPSFVPPQEIRQLRDPGPLPRGSDRGPHGGKNRVEKLPGGRPDQAERGRQRHLRGLRPGHAGRAGSWGARPKVLAQLARQRLRAKLSLLQEAFYGRFSDHHGFLLATMLDRIDQTSAAIATLEAKIERQIVPFQAAVVRLDEICGVGRAAAQVLIAEIGIDMGRFPTPGHLVAWARFAPGSRNRRASRRARPAPGAGTRTWPGCWARRP